VLLEKRALTIEELDAQAALELPPRDLMLVTVIITNVLNNLSIDVDVRNNKVAVQVCAIVALLGSIIFPGQPSPLTCEIQQ
jgi:hypothetical protein